MANFGKKLDLGVQRIPSGALALLQKSKTSGATSNVSYSRPTLRRLSCVAYRWHEFAGHWASSLEGVLHGHPVVGPPGGFYIWVSPEPRITQDEALAAFEALDIRSSRTSCWPRGQGAHKRKLLHLVRRPEGVRRRGRFDAGQEAPSLPQPPLAISPVAKPVGASAWRRSGLWAYTANANIRGAQGWRRARVS